MKCPYCQHSVDISAAEWKNQPSQEGTRKCPHCGGVVKNLFSGPVPIAILLMTLGSVVVERSFLPVIPMPVYGIL